MKGMFICRNWVQAYPLLAQMAKDIKGWMFGNGTALVVTWRTETRNDAQNALLHASLSDIAQQCEWAGRKWDIEAWKRLLTAAWCRVNAQGVEIVPAIDGAGFDVLYQRTSKLTKGECADLTTYIHAWGVDHNVKFSAPAHMEAA